MFLLGIAHQTHWKNCFVGLTIEKCIIKAFVKIYFKVLNDYIMICSVSSKLYMLESESLII